MVVAREPTELVRLQLYQGQRSRNKANVPNFLVRQQQLPTKAAETLKKLLVRPSKKFSTGCGYISERAAQMGPRVEEDRGDL